MWSCIQLQFDNYVQFINDVSPTLHHLKLSDYCMDWQIELCKNNMFCPRGVYRVSQEEWTKLRESVPYVKLYRYNPKHLCPKLNGYGDKGQRKVWSFCGSTYCTWSA